MDSSKSQEKTEAPEANVSPMETIRRLHKCRVTGQYQKMLILIAPQHREAIMNVVLSADELIGAEARLLKSIQKVVGEGSAAHFGQRNQVANILGPLSHDVEVLEETLSGNTAQVTIQVANRVPLETIDLERIGGVWLLVSNDPIPPGLAVELRNLAKATYRVADELERRQLTKEQVFRELTLRQTPILKRIAKLMADAAPKEER